MYCSGHLIRLAGRLEIKTSGVVVREWIHPEGKAIYGVDEAGRGPLAGPVYAACVVLDSCYVINGLADSKRLSEKRRASLAEQIKQHARAWAIASASVEEIDRLNILQASMLAMRRAVIELMPVSNALILVDGTHVPQLDYEVQAVIRGDSLVAEISAASILAKTARDAEMLRLHEIYPIYGFDRHKGYPTRVHLDAIRLHGITATHRKSFAPCAEKSTV
ncbi:RNase HII [Nitrosomonas eutropha]|nr:ribonuclease HII [Nitrosomonas sp. GH22]SCX11622.1 RNase HII [Nitrosomonas eutropha]SDW72644.1 RNase HII [Nitrosomonas eutropha]